MATAHDVPGAALSALAHASLGPAVAAPCGLRWHAVRSPVAGGVLLPAAAADLREEQPPHPARLLARNPGPRPVLLTTGTVIGGGQADRVLTAAVLLPAGSAAPLAVLPAGARWWPQEAPRVVGTLAPWLGAVLLQALLAGGAAAASARTLLVSASVTPSRPAPAGEGWVVFDTAGVVGLLVVVPTPGGYAARAGGLLAGIATTPGLRWRVGRPAPGLLEVAASRPDRRLLSPCSSPGG